MTTRPEAPERGTFLLLQVANLASAMANAMAFIAIPWLVIDVTGSALQTGIVAGVSGLPAVFLAPVAGLLIDRWGSHRVSVGSDVLSGLSVILFPLLAWWGGLSLSTIILVSLLGATFDPAGYTARKTLILSVARRSGVTIEKANSVHQALFGLGFALGPGIAALLIGFVGSVATFWVIGAFFAVAALAVAAIRRVPVAAEESATEMPWWHDALEGFRVLRRDPALLLLTGFIMVVDFVYMPSEVVILPTYFHETNQPLGMGAVIAGLAVGSVIGSYSYAPLRRRFSNRAIITGSVLGASAGLFGLAFFPPLWVMVLAGLVVGTTWGPMGPLFNTLVHTRVPESAHGRVFGAQMALFSAGPPLGMVVVGALVEGLSVEAVYPILVSIVAVMALALVVSPGLRTLSDSPRRSDPPTDTLGNDGKNS